MGNKEFDVLSNRIAKQLSAGFGRLVKEHKSVAVIGDRGSAIAEYRNRSPKGNMWSAIPVALLYMIEN